MIDFAKTAGGTLTIDSWNNTRGEIHAELVDRAAEFGIVDTDAISVSRVGGDPDAEITVVSQLGFDEWPE